MAISFPGSPSNGQIHTHNGRKYEFDGKRWKSQSDAIDLDPYLMDSDLSNALINYPTTSQMNTAIAELADSGAIDSVATEANLDANAPAGTIAYVQADGGNLFYKNQSDWSSITKTALGTIYNPANSAQEIMDAGDSSGDGFYWIIIGGNATQVWCDMTNDGGGWMLAARVHTDNSRWTYNDAYWTNTLLLNEGQDANYGGHIKTRVYTGYAFSQVRLAMNTLSNGVVEAGWNGSSFNSFMGSSTSSSNSRTTWINWLETAWGSYGQSWLANCNQFGTSKTYNYQYVKIGGTINGENDCSSNDESFGFGLKGISPYTNNTSCGSFSPYGKSSGNRLGWIFLK